MGKSIRSKRMKKLRTLKREKLAPREQILLEQRAAIISIVKGEEVDESAIPQLPEDANAPKRFVHTRDGKAPRVHTLQSKYGHLARNNVSITKWNTLEALKERYDKKPVGAGVKVKKEDGAAAEEASEATKQKLPTTMAQRRGRGRDRTSRSVTGSSAADDAAAAAGSAAAPVKVEDDDDAMADADADAAEVVDSDDDKIRYGEFGKPAHTRQSVIRSKLSRKRSKSRSKGGFLNCQTHTHTH